jgi:DNA-binding SARP family transcriptional activator
MKQTILSKKESPLLEYAISKLNPEVFSHPVWVRFGNKGEGNSSKIIGVLFNTAQKLQNDNPSDACQLMLACSVFQIDANQHQNALATVQRVLALAKRTGLTRELLWANWGACAICVQQGNYDQATIYIEDLQIALSGQNEWVLANFVDVVKQSLLHAASTSVAERFSSSREQAIGDLLSLTYDWLQKWGAATKTSEEDLKVNTSKQTTRALQQEKLSQTSFSALHRRGYWNTLKLAVRGELRLQWVEKDRNHTSERLSFWQSILNSLLLSQSGRKNEPQIVQDVPQVLNITNSPPKVSLPAFMSDSINNPIPEPTITVIPMTVQMLGHFSITVQDSLLKLHATRGLSLLKYLLLYHKQNTPREVLMDIFWPDADPEAARNNLNVAIHGLRQVLRTVTDVEMIHFEDGAYGLSPDLEIWLDVEEFERCIKTGQRLESQKQLTAAVAEYEIAVNLYRGDFLADNPYEGWTVLDRERLRIAYLDTLDHLSQIYFSQERYAACVTLCQLILTRDLCREDAHCRLMQCYSRLGQGPLALRQYQICVEALRVELEVEPAPETIQLYNHIRRREHI